MVDLFICIFLNSRVAGSHLTIENLIRNECLDLRLFILTKWKKYGYVVVKFVKVYLFLWFEVLRPMSYG